MHSTKKLSEVAYPFSAQYITERKVLLYHKPSHNRVSISHGLDTCQIADSETIFVEMGHRNDTKLSITWYCQEKREPTAVEQAVRFTNNTTVYINRENITWSKKK